MKRSVIFHSPDGWMLLTSDGRRLPCRAWTGGNDPVVRSREWISARSAFFRMQVRDWLTYWEDFPDKSTRRLFRQRAGADAHRTLNPW